MKDRARSRTVADLLDYPALADLRYQLRRFIRVREVAARRAGVEPQQYLALLQIKGLEGRHPATIGALSERLQIRHHAVVQLVDRLVGQGLAARERTDRDRREVVDSRAAGRGEGTQREVEFRALVDARLKAVIDEEGLALVSYASYRPALEGAGPGDARCGRP
jgi:DNA-binding MarR family transcriptional regulator